MNLEESESELNSKSTDDSFSRSSSEADLDRTVLDKQIPTK